MRRVIVDVPECSRCIAGLIIVPIDITCRIGHAMCIIAPLDEKARFHLRQGLEGDTFVGETDEVSSRCQNQSFV